jgi:hypothetical protein
MAGPLTGPYAAYSSPVLDGAKLAVDQHNKANPHCQVKLKECSGERPGRRSHCLARRRADNGRVLTGF